jgi:hypothetical protein
MSTRSYRHFEIETACLDLVWGAPISAQKNLRGGRPRD